MIALTLNDKCVRVPAGQTVLEAARSVGVDIPTLCHHPAVAPEGACRMCVVEVRDGAAAAARIVPSCLEPVREGLSVQTSTGDVMLVRRSVLSLLLERAPGNELLRRMATEHGVGLEPFAAGGDARGCILCTLCVRTCAAAGFNAISMFNRGARSEVGGPLGQPPPDCTGCAACARVCPTGHIEVSEQPGRREIWGRSFELASCDACGSPTLAWAQIQHAAKRLGLQVNELFQCPTCKRRATAASFQRLISDARAAESSGPDAVAGDRT